MKQISLETAYMFSCLVLHNEPDAYAAGEHYFPDNMQTQHYYQQVYRGLEIKIAEKLAKLRSLDKQAKKGN